MDPQSSQSQYRQLVDQLRQKISQGSLAAHSRLASTRALAENLGLARGIVLEAIDQLKMEGYLETRRGSGTYVRPELVWPSVAASAAISTSLVLPDSQPDEPGVSKVSFAPGMPDLSLFPKRKWIQCYQTAVEYASEDDLAYTPPPGRLDLREAIARHLFNSKGMQVSPASIVVTAGSSQAMALLAQVFPAAQVMLEDPQAPFMRRIFQGLGCAIEYAPADEQGLLCRDLPQRRFDLIYLTPAHQFPLGGSLPADRRVRLLHYAREHGSWIIEDDFDSEFRYAQNPVSPLQVLAPERVVYVGSFSKNLSPALRIGFMVAPPGVLAKVKTLKRRWDFWNEGLQQKALAIFMVEGHFERHIRRAFRAYQAKNRSLRQLLALHLGNWEILGASTGMHLVVRPPAGQARSGYLAGVAGQLNRQGFKVELASEYCQIKPAFADGLILAYGNRSLAELETAVRALADIAGSVIWGNGV